MTWLVRIPVSILTFAIVSIVWLYRGIIRPMLPATCKYEPGCSEYMILAVRKHGPILGCAKGVWRICRCSPFGRGGIDYP